MRIVKITLIILLAVVSVLYGFTAVSGMMAGQNTPPTLSCDSRTLEISVHDDESVLFADITATDLQDGDLTDSVRISGISKFITQDTAKVTYVVFDRDHNVATLTRYLHYTDYRSPRFSISEPLNYYSGQDMDLLTRLNATDLIDGDITGSVRVSALTATSDPETYTVAVQVTNSMGDTARLTVPVIQMNGIAIRPEVTLRSYLEYLEQGAGFDAKTYLLQVTTPEGTGDIDDVIITGSVDTATPGTYMVRFTYSYNGTSGSSILTVVVE